jgi:drug/metabolite transporter (DMT)-like permease
MVGAEIAALAAALCWSFGGLIATRPVRALGAVRFNRVRMSLVFAMLSLAALFNRGWWTLNREHFLILIVSALIGICLGDTSYYGALKRLGPRRSGILFATNAPITAILGYLVLDERLPAQTSIGCALIMTGVFLAVFFGTVEGQQHSFEKVRGSLPAGVVMALFAAVCQAVSVIIVRPVMASGVDAVAASALRVGTAAVILSSILVVRPLQNLPVVPLTWKLLGQVALSGLVGMALGMTFLLFALAYGPAGLVSTLSATSPILILPILWAVTRERPAVGAWVGAVMAVAGAGCIFNT